MENTFFSKSLFWDSDASQLDISKSKLYIIERVLTRGNFNDFKKMLSLYPLKEIKLHVVKIKDLDPKTLNFCSFYFDIPKEKFECYMKPYWTEKPLSY
jgi:hypothetical protein